MIWKWQSKYFAFEFNDISSQLQRTFPGKGTLTADHAGIISLPPIGIFDQRDSGKFGAGITTGKIITPYIIKANFLGEKKLQIEGRCLCLSVCAPPSLSSETMISRRRSQGLGRILTAAV